VHEPAVLADDAVHRGKAEPGSFSEFFGGEERLEDALERSGVHARSLVADA
jgi:hypothetical protein